MDLAHQAFSREDTHDLETLHYLHKIEQRTELKLSINSIFDFSLLCSEGHFMLM